VNSIWGESVALALTPYEIHWLRIYRFRFLTQCVRNISYWLPLNGGFRCNITAKLSAKCRNKHCSDRCWWSLLYCYHFLLSLNMNKMPEKPNKYVFFCIVVMLSGEVIHIWRQICFERKRGDISTTNSVLITTDRVLTMHSFHVFSLNKWYF
jgi:hypothetical protein